MVDEKFTYGRWYIHTYETLSTKGFHVHSGSAGTDITICRDVLDKNDAQLITAAPDMYRALKKTRELMIDSGCSLESSAIMRIDLALAKADGNQ